MDLLSPRITIKQRLEAQLPGVFVREHVVLNAARLDRNSTSLHVLPGGAERIDGPPGAPNVTRLRTVWWVVVVARDATDTRRNVEASEHAADLLSDALQALQGFRPSPSGGNAYEFTPLRLSSLPPPIAEPGVVILQASFTADVMLTGHA